MPCNPKRRSAYRSIIHCIVCSRVLHFVWFVSGLLQAPGGFMIGIHVPCENGLSRTSAFLRDLHGCRSLVAGTYVVDLTANTIAQYSGRSYDRLDHTRVDNLLKVLPFGPKFRLQSVLKKIATEFSIGPQAINLGEFDSAFELQSAEGLANAEKWETFPTLQVRDAFFAFLIDFLGDYSRYILPPSEDLAADSYRTFQEEFAIAQYVEYADKTSRGTMELLLETQMFSALIQRRNEGRHQGLVFFERAGRSFVLSHLLLFAVMTAAYTGRHWCDRFQHVGFNPAVLLIRSSCARFADFRDASARAGPERWWPRVGPA
jgi:hypothetical protein